MDLRIDENVDKEDTGKYSAVSIHSTEFKIKPKRTNKQTIDERLCLFADIIKERGWACLGLIGNLELTRKRNTGGDNCLGQIFKV